MGAYSNPEILVDTQSGQHWRNLQEQINRTNDKVTSALMERARKNSEFGKIANENTKNLKKITSKLDIKNPNLDLPKAFQPLIDKYEKLQNDIAFGKSKNVAFDRSECQKIEAAIDKTTDQLGDLSSYGENYKQNIGNLGKAGGYSQYNDPVAMEFGAVLTNNKRGKVELAFDLETYEPNLSAYTKMKNDDGSDFGYSHLLDISSTKLNELLDSDGGLKTVPASTTILEGLAKNPEIFGSKGEILEGFFIKEPRIKKEVSKDTLTNNKLDKDINIVYKSTYIKPDADKIKAAIETNVDATIEGLIAEGNGATFYSHYVNRKNPIDLDSDLTDEQKAEMKTWISDSFIKTLPELEDKNSPETVEYVTKQTSDTSSGGSKGNDTKAKTTAQTLNENLNGSYTEPGTRFKGLNESVFVKVGKDGQLYKVDKDEGKLSSKPLSLKEARIYLGLPANGVLTVKK